MFIVTAVVTLFIVVILARYGMPTLTSRNKSLHFVPYAAMMSFTNEINSHYSWHYWVYKYHHWVYRSHRYWCIDSLMQLLLLMPLIVFSVWCYCVDAADLLVNVNVIVWHEWLVSWQLPLLIAWSAKREHFLCHCL